MLNFVFWVLLALNALVFAVNRGYLGNVSGSEHEPARAKNQLATDKIKLLAPAEGQAAAAAARGEAVAPAPAAEVAAAAPSTPAPAPQPAAAGALVACTEVGSFSATEARRFETRLARLELGERQSRREVEAQNITSYLVYFPPQASKEAADRKAAELRGLGVENLFILSADSPYKWAISLGVFKTEAAAQTAVAALVKQGVQGVRIAPRGPMGTRVVYQFRSIDPATRDKITGYAERFNAAQVTACR